MCWLVLVGKVEQELYFQGIMNAPLFINILTRIGLCRIMIQSTHQIRQKNIL